MNCNINFFQKKFINNINKINNLNNNSLNCQIKYN